LVAAGDNKLTKADFTLVKTWRDAEKAAADYMTNTVTPKKTAMTNAYGEVEG
jgi:hypothetical protein